MKVLLIAPPIEDFFFTHQRAYPLGLLALAAPLLEDGFGVRVLNALQGGTRTSIPVPKKFAYLERYYQPNKSPLCLFSHYYRFGSSDTSLECEIRSFAPDIVGISANFSAYLSGALNVACIVKRVDARIRVVVGGHAATASPEYVLSHACVDFAVRGEGEVIFHKLCKALRDALPLPRSGLCYKISGRMRIEPAPEVITDLNSLPAPAHELIARQAYRFHNLASASLITSRGCMRHCRFCAIQERFRARPASSVIEEIRACYDLGVRHFNFEDDTITHNPAFGEILEELGTRFTGIKISLMNGLLSHNLSGQLCKKLIRAGLTHLDFSLISSNHRLRRACSRLERPERIYSVARAMSRVGIDSTVHFIVGLPQQRFRDALKDLRLLAAEPVQLGQSIFYPVIESPMFENLQDTFGINESDFEFFRSSAAFFDKALSRDELFTVFYYSRVINFVKNIIEERSLGTRSFAALLGRVRRLYRVEHSFLHAATALDRQMLGIILLGKVLEHGVIFRAHTVRAGSQLGYRLTREEFIDIKTTRTFFSGLCVCSCRSRCITLPVCGPVAKRNRP
ncbi:MAG: radical SAM protein [Candidatus Omnitrophota bacterium]